MRRDNQTMKLYYMMGAYAKECYASVVSCEAVEGGYRTLLDRTVFFPEEGGQTADSGTIDGIAVTDVREENGLIYHYTATPIEGSCVYCAINFEERFEKMQCHTAEHILCGIIHKKYKYENVGFHLGADVVTFDVDGELTREQLDEIEALANEAVFANLSIKEAFPQPFELEAMEYRSKLDLTQGVRIITIDGIDACACCAPHVSKTGEVGIIKILDFMRHRGGTRITMVAGRRALRDYHHKYLEAKHIGALTSTHHNEIAAAVDALAATLEEARREAKALRLTIAKMYADRVEHTDGNAICLAPDMSMDELREIANIALVRVGGMLVALTGVDGDYKYIISSSTIDLRAKAKEINTALAGRGGGRPEMIQGSFGATIAQIKAYFGI